ncbi:extracellular solute-binding protein [Paenibacillus sp. TRM 82003]|uniref:ABC transporter substrate-binding protein n=1 Tax=Kineococcus sp. TRM81007 TaxID=2925831 RepID=UPI001F590B45|nr:extracellular solute-binding protein [Kineococcus sp. TRM81007]MCI2238126.1 extracellular solute-binding protein [Kineococcus sp. TRM81007]MCI3920510.1 extracellular solute-binding protein [Paenibacillus sp. TRM 82003]
MNTVPPLSSTASALSRRRVLALSALAGGAALTASACSGGSSASSDPNTFEFWSFTGINQKDSVEEYKQLAPEVTVKLTEVGNAQETAQGLTTALAGGKVPDLVLIQAGDLPKFMKNPGNFVDLTTLGADDIQDDYVEWVMAQATAQSGEIIGIPTDVGGMGIAYRTDLMAAAGLPTNRDEVSALWPTWEDFIATGQRYTEATGMAFIDNAATTVFLQAVSQGEEQYYSADGEVVYDTNPIVRESFDLGLQAIAAGITAKLESFTDGWNAGMAKGAFAAVAAPSWMLGSIRSAAPDTAGKWDIATIPGGSGNWGGSYLAIPARAANPQAAWDYITTMQSPEQQLQHFIDAGSLPTTPVNYDKPELVNHTDPFFSDAPTGKIFTQAVLGLEPFVNGEYNTEISTELLNALNGVEGDGAPADAAWDTATKNIKTAIGA